MDKHILESEGKQISLEKTPLLSSKCQRMLSILLNKKNASYIFCNTCCKEKLTYDLVSIYHSPIMGLW